MTCSSRCKSRLSCNKPSVVSTSSELFRLFDKQGSRLLEVMEQQRQFVALEELKHFHRVLL